MHLLVIRCVLAAAVWFTTTTGVGADDHWVLTADCLSGAAPPSAVVGTYQAAGTTISLRCGTPVSTGVLHIDDDHEITPGSEFDFVHCVFNVFTKGAPAAGRANRVSLAAFDLTLPGGRTAIGVYDRGSKDIVTVYTSGAVSNDWAACSHAA